MEHLINTRTLDTTTLGTQYQDTQNQSLRPQGIISMGHTRTFQIKALHTKQRLQVQGMEIVSCQYHEDMNTENRYS